MNTTESLELNSLLHHALRAYDARKAVSTLFFSSPSTDRATLGPILEQLDQYARNADKVYRTRRQELIGTDN